MVIIKRLPEFQQWLARLRDGRAVARIAERLERLRLGNPGDHKSVGKGVMELRVTYGPGYRVYYVQLGDVVIVLLCGGDKSTQHADIRRAHELAKELDDGQN
ncbi:type II toxin-antitoxin system RelE/ParE family toxin [Aureimonas glaciei]|uniref:type II toxin-antitoxin system RelE/ParE family toxin n=1 Tax=Aureimonas glaciei TaxID=1776957 RepID=UPI001662DD2B|nr:type II toxin-antitoxin system RelE/ParE family toxin [Aureimonas glaciei]